ncbi:hypothetical protein C2G38_2171990 [Gigaspora rosea]|uniref:Uncharacterized protein n=1 Tax=Gigaspora rosea TaxID=44941 RepID=A0A397VT56_9GLOM|nr:hypothetical protein C2G38_2171990 [Gigaspora rosea]
MPATRSSKKSQLNNASSLKIRRISKKKQKKIRYQIAVPESNGYHYLNLFRRESWEEIAEFCGANPSAQDVCAAALQRKEMLVEHRIKPTKIDAAKTFDIEVAEWYDETHTKANNWWNVRDFIGYIIDNDIFFDTYHFICKNATNIAKHPFVSASRKLFVRQMRMRNKKEKQK